MIRLIYTSFIYLYAFVINITSIFNPKAKLWVSGRKDIFKKIELKLKEIKSGNKKTVWVHCASLGEFEQGRPLIEKIKLKEPTTIIILTFFSPSGYEVRKNYTDADLIFYLPIDTLINAKKFITLIKPSTAFFIKYEFWFNYLYVLKTQNIPTYLISGIFRENHYFFKWYGTWFKKQLNCFSHFYLQTSSSEKLLHSIGYTNTTIAGDTRFDRVFEIAKHVKTIALIEEFKQDKKLLIAGSTWPEDELILSELDFLSSNYKMIIAPHEINEEHLKSIEESFSTHSKSTCLRYSTATELSIKTAGILIIDNIGMLSSLYQYGTIAYIGGGFDKGIHNILEAATFGLPIVFGPNYHKFKEAVELLHLGGAFTINNIVELKKCFVSITNPDNHNKASCVAKNYVLSNTGATEKIISSIALK